MSTDDPAPAKSWKPHCLGVNQFPEFQEIFIFICDFCGEPVELQEPVQ